MIIYMAWKPIKISFPYVNCFSAVVLRQHSCSFHLRTSPSYLLAIGVLMYLIIFWNLFFEFPRLPAHLSGHPCVHLNKVEYRKTASCKSLIAQKSDNYLIQRSCRWHNFQERRKDKNRSIINNVDKLMCPNYHPWTLSRSEIAQKTRPLLGEHKKSG